MAVWVASRRPTGHGPGRVDAPCGGVRRRVPGDPSVAHRQHTEPFAASPELRGPVDACRRAGARHTAPRGVAAISRRVRVEQLRSHDGVQPVGTYDDVAGRSLCVLEADDHAVGRLPDVDGARVEPHHIGGQRGEKQRLQIRSQDRDGRLAPPALEHRSRLSGQPSPATRADAAAQGPGTQAEDGRRQPESPEDVERVGPESDAGTDLTQLRSLLVDRRLDAHPPQRDRRGQATDAASHDDHPPLPRHAANVDAEGRGRSAVNWNRRAASPGRSRRRQ